MAQLFLIFVGFGICVYICGFAGRLFSTNEQADSEYKKSHQALGSAAFGALKPFIAVAIGLFIGFIIIAISMFDMFSSK